MMGAFAMHMARRTAAARRVTASLAIAVLAASCASGDSGLTDVGGGDEPSATAPSSQPALASPTRDTGGGQPSGPVPEVLRFTAPQLSGGTVQGASFAGSDLALWFWAPW